MVRGGKNRSGGGGVTLFAVVPVTLLVLYLIGLVLDSAHEPLPYALIVPLLGLAISGVAIFQARRQRSEQAPAESGDLLVQYAYHDALTDLPNRLLLRDRLTLQLASIRRTHISVAMLMIDLDGFKQINDTYGHLAGDELLVQVAERIRVTCRETDTVARLGGDEFAVLQAIEEQGQAKILAGRIIKSLAEPFELSKGPVQIGCSIGITITQDPEVRLEELINEADVALYRSKKLGGNAETFFDRNFDHLAEAV
jgi:diguanylate cyclase (GGDEF)-like protein